MPRSVRTSLAPCEMLRRMPSCSSSRPLDAPQVRQALDVLQALHEAFLFVAREPQHPAVRIRRREHRLQVAIAGAGRHSVRTGTGKGIAEEGDGDTPADIVPAF